MAEIHTPFGRVYEDFEVGDVIKHWPGRTITAADDTIFSLLALNQHPLHIDAHYASQSQFGENLVNGTLVFSIAVGMTVNDISGAAIAMLEYENVKHLAPTFHGDTLYGHTKILDKRESKSKNDRGIVYVETVITNQREEDVMSYRRKLLIPKSEYAARPFTHKRK
ncbi:MaoC family dehydratase [Salinibacillus xinjiangensis]|uniref:MaoC family dehydratase n=1 Tax=Salinibacillus xinjiangensis TaxID=1229268 RepID=A0A6G1X1L7_9BACI|nr:MaoC family dehydratase [Salinibacillus xinjiangensis]MRG84839.1 MaoC family dehydratase [Salinibacillus xinjiangensis]